MSAPATPARTADSGRRGAPASDGSYRTMISTLRLIESGPNAGGILLNGHDVTGRRAIEAELLLKEDELRQGQKMEARHGCSQGEVQ